MLGFANLLPTVPPEKRSASYMVVVVTWAGPLLLILFYNLGTFLQRLALSASVRTG
jgi:hypothetical protein